MRIVYSGKLLRKGEKNDMLGITKAVTLMLVMCLCMIIPLDIQPAPAPEPVRGHIVVEVIDEFTHTRIPNATVEVWYKNTRYFAGYCARTDNDLLVTENVFYWYDELVLVVWHEDYYLRSIHYTVPCVVNDPYGIEMEYVFMTGIRLFRKSTNTTADLLGEFPVVVHIGMEFDLMPTCTLQEENTVFGMAHEWVEIDTEYVYSEGMVIVSSNRIIETFCDYAWKSPTRFYYGLEIGRFYNDVNVDGDGTFVLQIPITMTQDCEMGVSVIDTVRITEVGLSYYHNVSTFTYVNGTLDRVGDVQVKYGYQPSYVYPAGYIPLEDLHIIWEVPENTRNGLWLDADLVDLYIAIVCVAGVVFVIWVVYWMKDLNAEMIVYRKEEEQ